MVRKKKKITESKANPSMSEKETVSSKEKAASKETKSPWNTDVDIDTSNFEKAVDTAVEFEPVLAEEVLEQAGVSIKVENKGAGAVEHPGIAENLTGIKPSVSSNQKRHLLVPVNVQALVVPPEPSHVKQPMQRKSGKQESGKDELTKPIQSTHPKMANLKTAYRSADGSTDGTSPEEDLRWDIPGPFDYISSNPNKTGHPVGIHLLWTLPRALLTGKMKAKETLSEAFADVDMDESGYIDPSELIPEHFIVCDEGFEHPLTFKDAVENRIEFMTEDDSEITNLNELFEYMHLPDLWIVSRSGMNSSRKTWVIDSVNLEVTPLASFSSSSRNSKIPEMTAIGPNDGDFYWSATYDNAKGRFTFHDLPGNSDVGPFDYFVCGWYSDSTNDPVYMKATAAEEAWFKRIREDLQWNVNRDNIDKDSILTGAVLKFLQEAKQ